MINSTLDTVNELSLDSRTRSAGGIVACAWIVWLCDVVRFFETEPKCLVNKEIVDSVCGLVVFRIPVKAFCVQLVIQAVNRGSENGEGDELMSEGIKSRLNGSLGSRR